MFCVEAHQQLPHLLPVLDVSLGLFDVCEESGVRQDQLLVRSQAATVGSFSEHVDLAPAKLPRSLEGVRARPAGQHWGHSRLRSTAFTVLCVVAIGEESSEVDDVAARHGLRACPWREQDSLEQRVLFRILFHSGALEAVDGRNIDVDEDDLLRVRLGKGIVGVEGEDCR